MKKNKKNTLFLSGIIILIFIGIRVFEKKYFNDGLFAFFENDYITQNLPKISLLKVLKIMSIRFWVQSFLSILLLKLWFDLPNLKKFLMYFYLASYFCLIILFVIAWEFYHPGKYLMIFYIRRFIIQPILLFILIPALIYQSKNHSV